MTFSAQIKNVPPELVAQGWRLCPDDDVIDKWERSGPRRRWEGTTHGLRLLYRPLVTLECTSYEKRPDAYAHQGWGEGLAPTLEMCDIWRYWWLRTHGGVLVPVHAIQYADCGFTSIRYQIHANALTAEQIAGYGDWLGPVLPPVGVV